MAPILRTIVGVGISAALAFGMMPVASAAEDARADEDCTVHTSAVPASSADGDPSVGASASFGQTDLKENSWRYQNGELIPEEDGSDGDSSAAARAGEAWSLSEYGYLSSDGSVIEGALNKGIDVSEHQGWIDWEKVKADGIDFAIIRCGYGDNWWDGTQWRQDDAYWERNVSECERLGIPYGVYLYSYAQNPEMARSEADHALRLLEGHHPTIPVFFDMEDSSTFIYNEDGSINLSASRKNFGDMAEIFCEAMENAGYWAGVYANLTWFNTYLTDERFELYMRWVAQYNNSCWYDGQYMFWQCTSSAYVDGVDGPVDLNFEYFGFCYPSDVGRYDWYVQDGSYFYTSKFGYLTGYDNQWMPNGTLTRGMVATVLWRAAGKPWADAANFADVDYGQWYGSAIEWARQYGIISGYGNTNTFGPEDAVTREQLAVMLANYARAYANVGTWSDGSRLSAKPDAGAVSSWAWDALAWAVDCGIIAGTPDANGTEWITPQNNATRAEAAKMLTKFLRDVL